jgi:hypothetical protein
MGTSGERCVLQNRQNKPFSASPDEAVGQVLTYAEQYYLSALIRGKTSFITVRGLMRFLQDRVPRTRRHGSSALVTSGNTPKAQGSSAPNEAAASQIPTNRGGSV